MQDTMKHIVIVGGGSAGWLSACILAKQLNCKNNGNLKITLVESAEIPTVGVGEGTVPTMRQTLQLIGVSESEFVKECDATFKQSIKFVDWLHTPTEGKQHFYHHLFNLPHLPGFDLTPYWLMNESTSNYASSVSFQEFACEHGLSPKKITHKEFQGQLEYAYHLDAKKFSQFLSKHGRNNLGICHKESTITNVKLNTNGHIESLMFSNGESLCADFFVDCSGFRSRLLGQALNVGFVDKGHQLLVDTAVAMQVPYANPQREIPPYTIATAQEAGWTWDIGLSKRRGVGYVYSSHHTSDVRAEEVLRQYVGSESEGLDVRKIPMKIGYRQKFWHKNCVAIGLSAGFVEPLEATALLIVEATAKLLAEKISLSNSNNQYAIQSFNQITQYAWERVIDFIKLHYFLSKRTDNQFWLDNRDPATAPDSLLQKLEHWRYNVPCHSDFFSKYEVFQLENYQYVLYGMEFETQLADISNQFPHQLRAKSEMDRLKEHTLQIKKHLAPHREVISQIKQHGLSKI